MRPFPDINIAFSLLTQQERQMYNEISDSRTFLNTSDQSNFYGRGQTRGRGMRGQPMNTGGRGQSQKVYTYCKKIGHTIDTCYKKHGFSPHMKQRRSINNITQDDAKEEDNANYISQKGEDQEDKQDLIFTKEQQMKVLALLQQ